MTLVERFGLDETARRERQEFLGLTSEDVERLRQLRPAFAARARDKEPGRVVVTYREDGPFGVFGVSDNGPGIPAELRERIFEPFVHGPVRREGATGLGLYFVRSVIEQLGGKVWLESTPGQGSTFWFTVYRQPGSTHGDFRPPNVE